MRVSLFEAPSLYLKVRCSRCRECTCYDAKHDNPARSKRQHTYQYNNLAE